MSDRRAAASQSTQRWMAALASLSAVALLVGVARTLVTGQPALWPIGAAIGLATSLMLLRSLRRKTDVTPRVQDRRG